MKEANYLKIFQNSINSTCMGRVEIDIDHLQDGLSNLRAEDATVSTKPVHLSLNS